MTTPATRRRLGAALLLTLAATAYFWINDGNTAADASLVVATATTQLPKQTTATPDLAKTPDITQSPADQLPPRILAEASRDIFAVPRRQPEPEQQTVAPVIAPSVSLSSPPPASPAPSPVPPPPTAPPLPFSYLGQLNEEGRYTVFLSVQGRSYAVRAGEVVAQTYRIEAIQPPLLTVTYLPMKIKQTMHIGEAN